MKRENRPEAIPAGGEKTFGGEDPGQGRKRVGIEVSDDESKAIGAEGFRSAREKRFAKCFPDKGGVG